MVSSQSISMLNEFERTQTGAEGRSPHKPMAGAMFECRRTGRAAIQAGEPVAFHTQNFSRRPRP